MIEDYTSLTKKELEQGVILAPKFDSDGLIPAIVQDVVTGDIMMFAFMNRDALQKTLETGQSHFWSRSRKELWHKGATSGELQHVREILIDCDQDAIVLKVELATGTACHTGARSCFYRSVVFEDGQARLLRTGS